MAKNKTKLAGNEVDPNVRVRPQHTDLYKDGREYPDPTPMAPPIGFIKQPTLAETMRQMILSDNLKRAARESGAETFEEADDFEVGDDYDPSSPYEEQFEPPAEINPEEQYTPLAKAIAKEIRSSFQEEQPSAGSPPESSPPPQAPQTPPGAAPAGGGAPPAASRPNPFTEFFKG